MPHDRRPVALLLSPVWPAPGESGRALRAWDWVYDLARTHRVVVLVDGQASLPLNMTDLPGKVYLAPRDKRRPGRWLRTLALLCPALCLLQRHLTLDWMLWDWPQLWPKILCELDAQRVDRIVVFRLYLHDAALPLAQRFQSARLELDMDDLESQTRLSLAAAQWRMRRYRQALLVLGGAFQYWCLERGLRGQYNKVWLANALDVRRIRTALAPVVSFRPNRLPPVPILGEPPRGVLRMLFVGTLNYPPNEEAVRMLVLQVLPILRQHLKGQWNLCVIGRHATAQLQTLLSTVPEVEFVPDAPILTPWYEASHLALVPIRAGGGTKFKSIEAFAHKRPVVSTEHGMRGLGAVANVHYLRAHSPHEFARAIIALADDPVLGSRLVTAAQELLVSHGSTA